MLRSHLENSECSGEFLFNQRYGDILNTTETAKIKVRSTLNLMVFWGVSGSKRDKEEPLIYFRASFSRLA